MLLAVISDSHITAPNHWFGAVFDRYLAQADCLIHCGDMVGADLYHFLLSHPCFHAVRGNCDQFHTPHDLPTLHSFSLPAPGGGLLKIGMAHGWGERATVWKRVWESFPGHGLVCYGHTHRRDWSEHGGCRVLNPGSLAEGSLALVSLGDDGALSCEFVDISPAR